MPKVNLKSSKPYFPMTIDLSLPSDEQLEVSLFGPGVGESVCVHVGQGKWMIVDSCLNPQTKEPAALEYLKNLGVNPQEAVELVVITHWHTDHIKGLAKIVETCSSADVVWSNAFKDKEFLKFFTALNASPLPHPIDGETDEIVKTIRICKERSRSATTSTKMILASSDKIILNKRGFQVWCLSPSDEAVLQSKIEIGIELTSQTRARRRVPMTENLNSVALLVISPSAIALLGADLEVCPNSTKKTGWEAVLESNKPEVRASIFKIPHHGSITGHHDAVWETMIDDYSISLVTEYTVSSLPKDTDVDRLKKYTNELYRTTYKTKKPPKRDKTIEKLIDSTATKRAVLVKNLGHIQLRAKAHEKQHDVKHNELACRVF